MNLGFMRNYEGFFIVEDFYGPDFIKNLITKKQTERLLCNVDIKNAKRVPISSKMDRIIRIALINSDRVVVIIDADDGDPSQKESYVKKFISSQHLPLVRIVVLKQEIEDWICYSMNIKTRKEKPSSVLKQKYGYEKYRLKDFVSKIDCQQLSSCDSFQYFLSCLT